MKPYNHMNDGAYTNQLRYLGKVIELKIIELGDTVESAFERATLTRGTEEKLARVDWANSDVLIANVPDEAGEYTLCSKYQEKIIISSTSL